MSPRAFGAVGNGAEIFARSLDKNAEFEADRIAVVLARACRLRPVRLADGAAGPESRGHDRLAQLGQAIGARLDGVKGQTLQQRCYRIKP